MQKETETTRGNHQIYVQICTKMYVSRPFLYSNQKLGSFTLNICCPTDPKNGYQRREWPKLTSCPSNLLGDSGGSHPGIWKFDFSTLSLQSIIPWWCFLVDYLDFLWKLGHPSWFWQAKKVSLFHSCSSGSTIPPTSCKAIRKTIRSCPGATNTTWQELKRKISRFRT